MIDIVKFETLDVCMYCGSSKHRVLFVGPDYLTSNPGTFSLSKCFTCGLVFQNPRIKEEYIAGYYASDLGYYHPQEAKQTGVKYKLKKYIERQTLINHFNYTNLGNKNFLFKLLSYPFKRIYKIGSIPDYVGNGTVLEIGCSFGAHLMRLKKLGWSVTGQELNDDMVQYAKNKGLKVTGGRIEDISFSEGSTDVIILNMVLEHLYQPFQMIDKMTKWLKPNGQLIFSIPYFEGFEFNIFKKYSYGLQLPYHITFLNKKIIKDYLKRLGYTDIHFYFQFFDRDVVASSGYKYAETKRLWYKLISTSSLFRYVVIKPLVYVMSLLHKTSRVTVHAIKKYQ